MLDSEYVCLILLLLLNSEKARTTSSEHWINHNENFDNNHDLQRFIKKIITTYKNQPYIPQFFRVRWITMMMSFSFVPPQLAKNVRTDQNRIIISFMFKFFVR